MGLPALKYDAVLQAKTCPVCFIHYAAPELLFEKKMEKGGNWFCPNGHSLVFTETEVDKLKKQLESERTRVEFFKREAEGAKKQEHAAKAVAAKVKKKLARVENGVCPQCNRTFANVARHMQTKHGIECNTPPKGSKVRAATQK